MVPMAQSKRWLGLQGRIQNKKTCANTANTLDWLRDVPYEVGDIKANGCFIIATE